MCPESGLISNRVVRIVAALSTLLIGCILATLGDSVAAGITAAFLVAAPATAVAVPLNVLDPLERIVLALAATVAVNALVAETMLAAGRWSIAGGVAMVGMISSAIWLGASAITGSSSLVAGAKRDVTGHPEESMDGRP